jgi:putative thiamine transport system ATP-binding protein
VLELHDVRIRRQQQVLIELPHVEVQAGEVLTLMGASGSGKSTLLNWLVGAPLPGFQSEGQAVLNGRVVSDQPAEDRHIGLRFQDPWLFPHMSVMDNLLFALPQHVIRGHRARRERALSFLQGMQLDDPAERMPQALSGGQAARISLARALINEPQAMLLDEPFSALDAATREAVKAWTFAHIEERGVPTILVTHDASDAPDAGRIIRL